MSLKINFNYLYLLLFTAFFFLWSVDITSLFKNFNLISVKYLKLLSLNHLILFLILPITYSFIRERKFTILKLFNNQKLILWLTIFIVSHFFFVNFFYKENIKIYEILNLCFIVFLALIYSNYRNFLSKNFEKILFLYHILFIVYSIYKENLIDNTGQCNNTFNIAKYLKTYFTINLSNSFYTENSHLAMMMVSIFFSSFFIWAKSKKTNFLLVFLLFTSIFILVLNYSTTFAICYFICQLVLIIFFYKKIPKVFWIFSILFLLLNLLIFFADKHCTKKITDFSLKDIKEKRLNKNLGITNLKDWNNMPNYFSGFDSYESVFDLKPKNLTTLIYERSIILTLDTFTHHLLGWGNDGMDNATISLMNKPEYETEFVGNWEILKDMNLKDGLSNMFKILNEFGIFSFVLLYFFIKYLIRLEDLSVYNIFIITLFITMSIRGAGYFNGGFIFCLFELFYFNKPNINNKVN